LYESGVFQVGKKRIQGIRVDHDRVGGRRFGDNIAWMWNQGGINVLHLGGAAAPISLEQQILMGRPDLLLLPVGGGPKAYNPEEARQAIQTLKPRMVIPTHYRTKAAKDQCDLVGIDAFLSLMQGTPIRRLNSDSTSLRPADLPKDGTIIQVMSYRF
jgi:L-ascorbate metabolism protein UlaG (beta-lactamase superfamily)